tara:strand:- start:279 stop:920 length:642 start_codon:yes stop_codon:yes gene_type:complete
MLFNTEKYQEIRDFIKKNNKSTKIIAVSKNHSQESVIAAINSGVYIFGENRVLEAKKKFSVLKSNFTNLELHLTGPLQSNKVKEAVNLFDVFHTLDREKIATEFAKYREKIENKKIFIQVNTGEESTKSGILQKDLKEFIKFCTDEKGLKICGLMCIPPINENPAHHFNLLSKLLKLYNLEKLSIGMSNDYEIAINYDATYIRVGTALFGQRN